MNYHGRPITWQRIRGRIRHLLGCTWLLSIADALIDLRVCGREERFRCHGLPLGGHFNSYSIWYYKPAAAE